MLLDLTSVNQVVRNNINYKSLYRGDELLWGSNLNFIPTLNEFRIHFKAPEYAGPYYEITLRKDFNSVFPENALTDWGDGTVDTSLVHQYPTKYILGLESRIIKIKSPYLLKMIGGHDNNDVYIDKLSGNIKSYRRLFKNEKTDDRQDYYIKNVADDILMPALISGATDFSEMFYNHKSLQNAPKIPTNAVNCFSMFYNCSNIRNISVIPSSVKNCSYMYGAKQAVTGYYAPTTLPNENIALMYNHATDLVHSGCYYNRTGLTYPEYSKIPSDWK